ncbi:MAG: (2Fe-2S)-binding protein [Dehalococcoidia bacterium]|nr:MAG: (2Fe-2S)-binding protein [Dehalococcoidia bacterium]
MTEKGKERSGGKTRREFLRDAGLLISGTAIGSTVILAACGGGETETVTNTVTNTQTVTSTAAATTVTDTVTTTVGGGATVTETTTATATVSKFVCPIDGMEFDSLAELQAHFAAEHAGAGAAIPGLITINVNGEVYNVTVDTEDTLAFTIREKCGLPATKVGCNRGMCGTCTVLLDGKPIYACMMLAIEAVGHTIETVEGLGTPVALSKLQQAFIDNRGFQCGYCTPGFLMAGTALLRENPNPTMDEAKAAVAGNICPCGNMTRIIKSIMEAGGA